MLVVQSDLLILWDLFMDESNDRQEKKFVVMLASTLVYWNVL